MIRFKLRHLRTFASVAVLFGALSCLAGLTACDNRTDTTGHSETDKQTEQPKAPKERWQSRNKFVSDSESGHDITLALEVRAYESGRSEFQLTKRVEASSTDFVRSGEVTDLSKVRTKTETHTLYLPEIVGYLPADKLPEVRQFFAKYREWDKAAEANNLTDVKKPIPNPWNRNIIYIAYGTDGKFGGSWLDCDGVTLYSSNLDTFEKMLNEDYDGLVSEVKQVLKSGSDYLTVVFCWMARL